MSYSKEIYNHIIRFLEEDNWKYRFNEEKEIIQSGLGLHGKMKHVDIVLDLRDDKYFVYFTFPLAADKDERPEVRELMNRINYGIMFGCFEMDERDGEIRFRYPVDCTDQKLSREIVKSSLYRPAATVIKYSDAFVKVIMGVATAKEAYETAIND